MTRRDWLCGILLTLAGGVYAEIPQCWRVPVAGGVERWCWWEDGIFDPDRLRPELAAVFDGRELVHGSRSRAGLSVHRLRFEGINPLPVPLDPRALPSTAQPDTETLPETKLGAARALLGALRGSTTPTYRFRLREGERQSMLPENSLPFAGYDWAAFGSPIAAGSASPLGKYDALVAGRTGQSAGAVAWGERLRGSWAQGWAASAILLPEPTRLLWDPAEERVIFVSDVKGMLAAAGACADRVTFRVHRSPAVFHRALVYFIDELKKPMVIGQRVVSGYRARLRPAGDGFRVEMTLRVHEPEHVRDEIVGIAPDDEITVHYWLPSEAGDGYWISRGPARLWSPIAMRSCGGVDPQQVLRLVSALPDARRTSGRIEERRPGSGYQITLRGGTGEWRVIARGERLYPSGLHADASTHEEYVADASSAQVFIPLSNLSSVRLVGTGRKPEIERVEFWSGETNRKGDRM